MGLAHNGKKIIGLAHNGKKILGIAHNGNIIWRCLPQLDPGTNMLSDIANFIIFDTNSNNTNPPSAGSMATSSGGSAKVYINSRIMAHGISETLTGVEINLSGKLYNWYNNSWYTARNYSLAEGSDLTIKLSKSSPTYTGTFSNGSLSGNITFSISGNTLSVKGMINPEASDEYIPEIASITAY